MDTELHTLEMIESAQIIIFFPDDGEGWSGLTNVMTQSSVVTGTSMVQRTSVLLYKNFHMGNCAALLKKRGEVHCLLNGSPWPTCLVKTFFPNIIWAQENLNTWILCSKYMLTSPIEINEHKNTLGGLFVSHKYCKNDHHHISGTPLFHKGVATNTTTCLFTLQEVPVRFIISKEAE